MSDVRAGQRCRLMRAVSHGQTVHQRGTEMTIERVGENEGRTLVHARLDASTQRLVLFPDDIESIASQEA